MNDRQRWAAIVGGGLAIAAGIGGLIYLEDESITALRADVEVIKVDIEGGRTLIAKTPALEREVIIQRETDSVVAQILPNDDDLNNFVRTLRDFQEASGARIVEVRNKNLASAAKTGDFDRVVYSLKFDANIFQMLDFTAQVEGFSRFMSIPIFKLSAAKRSTGKDAEEPHHTVQMDVETYVYNAKDLTEEARIDSYDRKRDLMLSEISKRQAELQIPVYAYKGQRGRRDPWVDPRVPRPEDGSDTLAIEDQIQLVEELVDRTRAALVLWDDFVKADNLIAQMKSRAELENALASLEEDVRQVQESNKLSFVSAERRFDKEVVEALENLNAKLSNSEGVVGPTVAVLQEAIDTVDGFLHVHRYDDALNAYQTIEPRLHLAENDAARKPMIAQLRWLARKAETVLQFDQIEMRITGVGLIDGMRPIAVINGESLSEGELVADELIIRSIREDEIEFVYRDVILARRIEP
ncbi:MAG: Tfp pilus assembly protein PilO [Planctomycetota bacterium]|jgi:Tfp pilus assembly protein PilO